MKDMGFSSRFVSGKQGARPDRETDYESDDAESLGGLPFVIGVLADLSGHNARKEAGIDRRRFRNLDLDNFDDALKQATPRVCFAVPNAVTGEGEVAVDITFESFDDFTPGNWVEKVPELSRMLEARAKVKNLNVKLDGSPAAEAALAAALGEPALVRALTTGTGGIAQAGAASAATAEQANSSGATPAPAPGGATDFASLLEQPFSAPTKAPPKNTALQNFVASITAQALGSTSVVNTGAATSVAALVSEFDRRLSALVNSILHHPSFLRLEGTWRGLRHIVRNVELGEGLFLRVANVSWEGLRAMFPVSAGADLGAASSAATDWNEDEYGEGHGPLSCLIGDFEFDRSAESLAVLRGLTGIAEASFAPLIAAASPQLFGCSTWQDVASAQDVQALFASDESKRWREFRSQKSARFGALVLPGFLCRSPYGEDEDSETSFKFEEEVGASGPAKLAWSNSAFAMAANLGRAFTQDGSCVRIQGAETGGLVEDLPVHTKRSAGGETEALCPTELLIGNRLEEALTGLGFAPLVYRKNTTEAVFTEVPSLLNPASDPGGRASAGAVRWAQLPCVFAACQLAQGVLGEAHQKLGSFANRAEMESWLNEWLSAQEGYAEGEIRLRETAESRCAGELSVRLRSLPEPLVLNLRVPFVPAA